MTRHPSISVCILSHNYACYIDRAINSSVGQEQGDYVLEEVVVSDDGSTDGTLQLCQAFGDVRTLRFPHRGFAANLSESIRHCRGEWVALLDADDWFTSNKLRAVAPHLHRGILLVQHAEYVVNEAGALIQTEPHPGGCTSTLVVNRAAAMELLPATNELFFHILDDMGHGIRMEEPLTYYRVHEASMTDRRRPGRYQRYMAGVCLAVARRLDRMANEPPAWASPEMLRRLSDGYRTRSDDHRTEAAHQEATGTLTAQRTTS